MSTIEAKDKSYYLSNFSFLVILLVINKGLKNPHHFSI